ncbi:integrase catalytic subunit [Caballeronia calidae]|uniref:Integrase catalytic subunit n=1 Tax=Caballeronia calidae TaxID=1777139 RepID=A0A158EC46_9BURK|nr:MULTISPECIES: ISNCY family transposase [Caballeronia]MCE4547799.1 ISNCY family transposase [Caballeronia sp. PC1]MCE4575646.1 ISNCY family transposase [Caballeronia sp. CLC5]SAL04290.1 integrase catalytic subunit [Caballeronia calidae]
MAAARERITMTMGELDRLKIIQDVMDGRLKPWRAAQRLELTTRQIRRLVARLREHGPEGLVSRKRSRPSNNRLDARTADRALSIVRERYADFGPTLACEKLRECHGIRLAKETLRKLMVDAGLWVPRRQRPPKVYQPRARRSCLGELIQIDGSDHAWFEDRAPQCTLLVYVDDATSRLMQLHFTQTESTFSYFEATRAYIERYGKPGAFYSDKASVFRNTSAERTGRSVTPFGRAMYELNIDTICANSSSAKGRVERAHLTLQDRLVKELRLRGINTMAEANAYALAFMTAYNARFAKPAKSDFDAHRPLRADENLETVLTWREPRIVTKALTVQYDRVMYLLDDTPENRKLIRRYVEVWEYPDGRIEIRADGQALQYREYDRLTEVDQGAIVEHKRLSHVLQVSQVIQAQRDNERIGKAPSRTHRGDSTRTQRKQSHARKKKQREFTQADIEQVIVDLAGQKQPSGAERKPGHRSARVNGTDANALPVHDPTFDTA